MKESDILADALEGSITITLKLKKHEAMLVSTAVSTVAGITVARASDENIQSMLGICEMHLREIGREDYNKLISGIGAAILKAWPETAIRVIDDE